jgi:hypothetical protein
MGIALDGNGHMFVADPDYVKEFTTSGSTVNANLITGTYPCDLAFDGSGNLFVDDYVTGTSEYTSAGVLVKANLAPGGMSIALDGRGNLFVSGADASVPSPVGEYTTSGTVINASLITGLYSPCGVAIEQTPEPVTLSLLALGGLALLKRRK